MSRFDIVVIGGGPAGMMAAARAAQYGARTVLIEKNKELGRKLMITGRGRCNFAHDEEDPEVLAQAYRHGGEFLLPSLRKFGTKETIAFFLRRGVVPAHERGRRIYPKEGLDATAIVNALWTALKDSNVQVLRGEEVKSFDFLGGKARRVITMREEIEGQAFIIATGGLSFPYTGSTGDGYRWARRAGHELTPTEPALCPVKVAEHFDSDLNGLKLKNVRVTLQQDDEPVDERFGEMDFTPFGISGAIIMDMASSINACLKNSPNVTIHIDLKPALDPERLDARINRDFTEFSTDPLRFALRKLLPTELIPEVIKKANLDMGKPCGETTPEERVALRTTLKDFKLTPTQLLGFHHAIITSGGVRTEDLNPETMASRIIPNLYFAGEIIDIDGPTGGYNLQECWSTGYAAGSAAAESLGFIKPTEEQILKQMVQGNARRIEQNNLKKQMDPTENSLKEGTEEMTIKTGPVDDKDFCGWRDPRKSNRNNEGKCECAERDSFPRKENVFFGHDKYPSAQKRERHDSNFRSYDDVKRSHYMKRERRDSFEYEDGMQFDRRPIHAHHYIKDDFEKKNHPAEKSRRPERNLEYANNRAYNKEYDHSRQYGNSDYSARYRSGYDNDELYHDKSVYLHDRDHRRHHSFNKERNLNDYSADRRYENDKRFERGTSFEHKKNRYSIWQRKDSAREFQEGHETQRRHFPRERIEEPVYDERTLRQCQLEERRKSFADKSSNFSKYKNDERRTHFNRPFRSNDLNGADTSVSDKKIRRRFTNFKRFRKEEH
jgi:predicted Rossmann fold flavoprotein